LAAKRPRSLADCHNIADLRVLAQARVPGPVFHHLDGAAEDESTYRRNTAAFDDYVLIPRCLVDVARVQTAVRVLGQDLAWPIICSPTGASRFYHPEGELAVARAAARAGSLYSLSTAATQSLEDVSAEGCGAKMFQLYIFKDREVTRRLIERCRRAGYQALCLTVDAAVPGKRERDRRTGWGVPIKPSLSMAASLAMHPLWLFGLLRRGPISVPNVAAMMGGENLVAQTRYFHDQLDASVVWKDVREMIQLWGGPFAIKGVMAVDDAQRAVDVGATAVIVSNHGGRQLDGAAASVEVLPEIARAVGGSVDVILDGGVRRGVHILKAMALGADACSIGRAYLFGLGAGGEAGVAKAFEILTAELVRAMQLSGTTDLLNIDPGVIRARAPRMVS